MTHLKLLTRGKGIQEFLLTGGRVSRDPDHRRHATGKGGKDDSNVAPFRTTRLAAYTHLLSNIMRSKSFLSHQILT